MIFNTVEFYIISAFIAAAVIAFAAMPSRRGPARQFLVGGALQQGAQATEAAIRATVTDSGALLLERIGLEGITMEGAYSLAVTVIGLDVTIDERLVPGRGSEYANEGSALLDCLGQERYHFNYRSEATGRNAAFSLNIRSGNRIERRLL